MGINCSTNQSNDINEFKPIPLPLRKDQYKFEPIPLPAQKNNLDQYKFEPIPLPARKNNLDQNEFKLFLYQCETSPYSCS